MCIWIIDSEEVLPDVHGFHALKDQWRVIPESPKTRTPAAPLYPILPDSQDRLSLDPPPYHPPPLAPQALPAAAAPPVTPLVAPLGEPGGWEEAAAPGPIENETNREGPAGRTRGRTQREPNPRLPDSTVALPLREIGPPDETGNPRLQYWPFSTSDLYNWKTQNARFSDNPKDLIAPLDSVMFTHQPTWDNCQQLLRILFTTEEGERIQLEARKLVPGDDGQPTSSPDLINAAFPLTRPPQDEWDYNTAEAAETPEACIQGTEVLLRTLGTLGYRASAKKAQICKSEGLLLNPLRVIFTPPTALNPASLLPDPDMGTPLHDCADILAQVYGVREDLQDQPLSDADAIWFTNGSSFVHQGQRYAGAAVTSETEVVWAEALPPRTSAQKAELIALTQALKLGRDRKLTVYTDSRYAFATAHVHGAIYRERGLLTAEGKDIKNKEEILALLAALWEPKKLAIVHCPGHQKTTDPVSRGNNLADQTAKNIARPPAQLLTLQLPDSGPRELPPSPEYSESDIQWMSKLPMTRIKDGWWRDSKSSIILPDKLGWQVLERIHRSTHLGSWRTLDLLNNASSNPQTTGVRQRGSRPGTYWEVDFTEVKPGKYGYKYLLVFVDTFSGWTEAFPTKNETVQIVAKKILEEILPRYGFPVMIGSDNGPAFVSKVSQGLASILGADWKLHCAYRPQSSGQVERMNRTLKETLTKLTMETGANWVVLLPYALFRVRNSPYKLGLTPYEIIHGRPPPIIPNLKDNLVKAENDNSLEFLFSLQALQRVPEDAWPKLKELYETGPPPIPHQFRPGDWVLIKRHRQGTLEPRWKGPFQVILTTPTAIKVDGIATWIHFAHAKPVDPFSDLIGPSKTTWTVDRTKDNPLKLTLRRQRTEP
ncbi:uncharacterized protein LOC131490745 [Neofelis nebulosa]|uniref:uncharacterized protein LOC131490745 n=1 Tax=Neofelis nebulosa TaxID=61452 RepID=UPI00272D6D02|nr:uncharacterized protein LOC131490745 [Neofelis nebulosa]